MEGNKNKYDFILELFEKQRIKEFQKEKILKLTLSELKNVTTKDKDILERIEKIEKYLSIESNSKINEQQNNISLLNKDLPRYINPSYLYNFLLAYNQDPVLKYTCHEIDDDSVIKEINKKCGIEQYNVVKHQELILYAFNTLIKQHKLSKNIYALIRTYIDGGENKGWSSDKIRINWKSTELINWQEINKGIPPNISSNLINKFQNKGFAIKPFKSSLTGERVNTFSKLVLYFKYLFHIKADNTLKKLIEIENDRNKWNDQIDFVINNDNFWENVELLTDVDKLIQAYRRIVEMIIEVSKGKPKVILKFKEIDGTVIFSVHHINSVFTKRPNDITNRLGEQHTKLINNQINGLCDLYLKANFGHSTYSEINLWNGKKREIIRIDRFEGVEHILKFLQK